MTSNRIILLDIHQFIINKLSENSKYICYIYYEYYLKIGIPIQKLF